MTIKKCYDGCAGLKNQIYAEEGCEESVDGRSRRRNLRQNRIWMDMGFSCYPMLSGVSVILEAFLTWH